MVEVGRALFEHFLPEGGSQDCPLKNWRFRAFYVLLYFTNGRFEEVSNLRFSDISLTEEGILKLIFRRAKNNQFGNAKVSFVASSGTKFCPVRLILS